MKARNAWFVAALPLIIAASGCGDGLVIVKGRVTYQGQPVPSTQVTFLPDDGSRRSTGLTDENGNFTLRYSRQQPGVSCGKHTVLLNYVVGNAEYLGEAPAKASKELKAVISTYGDPKTSPLHYEVKSSGQFFDIKLD
jgi:hypothetical protein